VSRKPVRGFYAGLFERFPWGVAFLLGVAAVALGVAITTKPFASLGVLIALVAVAFVITGVSESASATTKAARWSGVAWIAAAVVVAAWPHLSVRGLAVIVGLSLLIGGVLRIGSSIRGSTDERLISFLSGVARSVFGILALSWPDITLLVTALLIGPATILFGFGQMAAALHRRGDGQPAARSGSRWPRWVRGTGAALALVVAIGLLLISAAIHHSSNQPGAFYTAPADVPDTPGVLLRSEPTSKGIPGNARAWKILYTTTREDKTPAIASGLVVVAKDVPAGPRPVIAWAHGTTGYAPKCAPSVLPKPFVAGATPDLDQVIAAGWVMVATDYVGLGTTGPHPYLIGDPEARSVLDAVRAAHQLNGVELEKKTVVWGHSQGGGAALWTGILAPTYAPDDNVVAVAALSPATNLPALFDNVKDSPVGKIMGSYVLSAYSATYGDVHADDYVVPAATVSVRETAGRCLAGPEALVSVLTALGKETVFSRSPASGALGKRLRANIPTGSIKATLMIGQGLTDNLVLPSIQKAYVDGLCARGQSLQYRTYKGFDHVGVVTDPRSPLLADLMTWTRDRLAGKPQPPGCSTVAR
jgi:uncharacterized membrane protein HdeD (DUF308 family)